MDLWVSMAWLRPSTVPSMALQVGSRGVTAAECEVCGEDWFIVLGRGESIKPSLVYNGY